MHSGKKMNFILFSLDMVDWAQLPPASLDGILLLFLIEHGALFCVADICVTLLVSQALLWE